MTRTTTTVACPTCGTRTRWSVDNAFRPFCSERCKLVDLGAWASDRYTIAGVPADPMEAPGPSGDGPA